MGGRAEDAVTSRQQTIRVAAICAIAAAAAWLRFDHLGAPSYWLDEILGQVVMRRATAMPLWNWLIGFHPQHGPLYYAAQLVASLGGDNEWAGRSFAALCGVATIPLIWRLARRATGDTAAAMVAAILLAASPLHVYYSREARPYALLMLLTTALLVAVLENAPRAAIVLLAAILYTSVAATPVVAAIGVCALLFALLRRTKKTIAIAALVTLPLFALLYRGAAAGGGDVPFPGLSLSFVDRLIRGLAVTALGSAERGRTAYLLFALAVIGAIAVARRDRAIFAALAGMTVLPIAISVAALEAGNHFFAIRYVTPALPAYLVLAASGISFLSGRVARATPPHVALSLLVASLNAWQCWPVAKREPLQKLDWRTIASTLVHYAHPDDLVITAEPWSDVCLRYYLRDRLRVAQISIVILADLNANTHPGTWIVTAGPTGSTPMREWMCKHPMVLAGGLEEFRMHYAGDFLRERGTIAEERARDAAIGASALLLPDELSGRGWADVEDGFRWATSTRVSLSLPRFGAKDRVVRMRVLPYRPPQHLRVVVNGALAGTLSLTPSWSEPSVSVPAHFWRDGENEVTLEFDHAIAPASVEASPDRRTLAAAFEWIAIDDIGATPNRRPRVRPVRIASVCLSCAPGSAPKDLLGRLGLDPELHVDAISAARSIAWGTDCEDARAFIRRVFAVLLERDPSPDEERDLLRETSRERIVRRIIRGSEFRKRLT